MIPFSLMWGGFAIFWEGGVTGLIPFSGNQHGGHAPLFMAIWGIPFVLIGLYMIFGRFFGDAATRKRTYYGVTDRRLIVLKTLFRFNLTSTDLASTTNLNLNERANGTGDIIFGTPSPMPGMIGAGWPNRRGYQPPGFYFLPDAREVFNLIRGAQDKARRADSP